MEPFAYNMYSNDLILLLSPVCDIFSYADVNIACWYGEYIAEVTQGLQKVVSVITHFRLNEMKVNGKNLHMITFNRQMTKHVSLNVDGYVIRNEPVVKLLGLYTDDLY